jgi:hypothetical protein
MQKFLYFLGGMLFAGTIIFYFGDNFQKSPAGNIDAPSLTGDIVIEMKEVGGSGEYGKAGITFLGEKTKFSLLLEGAPYGTLQPAHIHKGTCAAVGEETKYKLNFPATGSSDSIIEASLAELRAAGPLAIDIHKSFADDKTIVSCGEMEFN